MSSAIYDSSVPVFTAMLGNMRAWLDKAASEKDADVLIQARLADDMRPLSAQYQMASDSAKNAIARLTGIEAPVMPDTETTFQELAERCEKTIAFLAGVDRAKFEGADIREVSIKFPHGMGFRWLGADYLRNFALPNFYFHATTAYAILRANGVSMGKPDYLKHLGPPEAM